jgi:damage-control phosphatase, subfamily I
VKPHAECGPCLIHWVFDRAAPHTADKDTAPLVRSIVDILLRDVSPDANLGTLCNNTVCAVTALTPGLAGHYAGLKTRSNEHAKDFLPEAATYIVSAATAREGFERSCFLAAAANVSPLGAPSGAYTFSEMRSLIVEQGSRPAIVGDVHEAVRASRSILYVPDNAGEIGFDALLMAQLKAMGKRVTLVVKAGTFFEDATMDDARFFGLEGLVDEIVTTRGFLASADLEPAAARALRDTDLVMAKGTGTYEALHGEPLGKPVVFMLKIKCEPIARELSMAQGTTVVKLEQAKSGKKQPKVKVEVKAKRKKKGT